MISKVLHAFVYYMSSIISHRIGNSIMFIMLANASASNTMTVTKMMRNTIIFNTKMPSLYVDQTFNIEESLKKSIYSIEHIMPRSYLKNSHYNDMHNVARTINELNNQRSNYKYADELTRDENWIKLRFDNYVNHKERLFIPNHTSRGFISRSLLYMSKEYHYNPFKNIIDKDVLIKWYYENPPSKYEIYHNKCVKDIQKKNNEFISDYKNNRKSKMLHKFLDSL